MDTTYKTEWLKRLRSGEWNQGQGTLCAVDVQTGQRSYCCLGVLAEIAVERGDAERRGLQGTEVYRFSDGAYVMTLSDAFLEQVGISIAASQTLIYMNDGVNGLRLHSFAEIADHIEAYL